MANWPAPRIHAWDSLLKARAIENMAYCIGVDRMGTDPNGHEYPGQSAAYDPFGHTLAYSETEGVLPLCLHLDFIAKARQDFPFLEDRDSFSLLEKQ